MKLIERIGFRLQAALDVVNTIPEVLDKEPTDWGSVNYRMGKVTQDIRATTLLIDELVKAHRDVA